MFMLVTSASLAVLAGTLGTTALIGGGVAAGAAFSKRAKKQRKEQEGLKQQEVDAQRKATETLLAAPEKAKERARLESLGRRRRRAKTLLTSPAGVVQPGELQKKVLLGA